MKKTIAFLTFASILSACSPETKVQMVPSGATPTPEKVTTKNNTIEGTVNGGGGKGVLCKKDGQETLEILDLYEGRVLYDLKFSKRFASLDEALRAIIESYIDYSIEPVESRLPDSKKKYSEFYRESAKTQFSRLQAKLKFIDEGKTLKSTEDANEAVVEADCESKQIALYYDENIVLVDKVLWEKLDYLNQAALILHEVVYKEARAKGDTNSVSSRRFVSHLLADGGLRPQYSGIPKNYLYACVNRDTLLPVFYLHQRVNQGVSEVVATTTFGYPQEFSKTRESDIKKFVLRRNIVFKDKNLADFLDKVGTQEFGDIFEIKENIFTGEVTEDTLRDPLYSISIGGGLPCVSVEALDKLTAKNQ